MLGEEVLKQLEKFRKKLVRTIQQLKQERFSILTTPEINLLQQQLEAKKLALLKFTNRGQRIGLSSSEAAQEEKLRGEVEDLQRKLKFQADVTNLEGLDKLSMKTDLSKVQIENQAYFWQLRDLHQKSDQLTDKLNWLRTLVRAGDLTQLQDLVKKGKI